MTIDSCGQKCSGLSQSSGRVALLLKMLETQSEWSSTMSATVWKESVTKCGRLLCRLIAPVRGSTEKEHLSWPRPTTGAPLCGGTHNFNQMRKIMEDGQITDVERRSLTQGNGGHSDPALMEWLMGFPIGWSVLSV